MRKRRHDSWDKPWVAVAVIAGVIIVLVMAALSFMGGSGTPAAHQPSTTVAVTQTPSSSGQSAATVGSTIAVSGTAVIVPVATTVDTPGSGVFVKVSYIGGFSGKYGVDGILEPARDSGDKIFALNKTSGNVQATFQKDDGSSKHAITVEIVKDGKTLKFGSNTSAYGLVSLSYSV
jgi:hypothetical protein